MHKTSKTIVSMIVAAAMTVGMFSSVMAQEPAVDSKTEEVLVTNTEEPAPAEDAEAFEVEEELQEQQKTEETEEEIVVQENFDRLTANDIVNGDDIPEVVLENLGKTPVDQAPIVKGDYIINRYQDRVVIKNNAETADQDKDLYAVILFMDKSKQKKTFYVGEKIPAGGPATSIYHVYNQNGDELPLGSVSDKDFTVFFGRETTWPNEETGEIERSGIGLIGWNKDGKEENIVYTENLPGDNIDPEPVTTDWWDGYKEIQMKANVTNNLQIKISWAPDGKDKTQKKFKKYKLYELEPVEDATDPNAENGYTKKPCWPIDNKTKQPADLPSTSKSATLNVGIDSKNVINSSMLYLLECYDNENKDPIAKYVTPVAPYMLQIQSGFDFTCTQARESSSMAYRLQLAKVNKDNDGKKVTEGFQDNWSRDYGFDTFGFTSIGDYPINKKLITKAVQLFFTNDEPSIPISKAGFGRVKTVAYINEVPYVSAPSNVLSCKEGPDSCYVWDIAGIIYDINDAKKHDNSENRNRAMIHYKRISGEDPGEFNWEDVYIHVKHNEDEVDTCAKSGMVFFFGLPNDETDIKAYELLRSEEKNGTYKKIKSYALNAIDLIRLDKYGELEVPVYAMQYNSFVPEKEYYYSVRAVSKTGNTPGSRGNEISKTTTPDKVQHMMLQEENIESIALEWKHDDCVKQYWLYRGEDPIDNVEEFVKDPHHQPLAKLSGGSFKKFTYGGSMYQYHEYIDKKVDPDHEYYYFVRPIYDTNKAKSTKYNIDLCSEVVKGKATARFVKIKNFTGANYSIKDIQLSFSQAKRLTEYRIWRMKADASDVTFDDTWMPNVYAEMRPGETVEQFEERAAAWTIDEWKTFFAKYGKNGGWSYVASVNGDGKSTGKKTYEDKTVEVGDYYYYLIQGATSKSSGFVFANTPKLIRNQPLPVTGLSSGWGGSRDDIKITWGIDKKDSAYTDKMKVEVSKNKGITWDPINISTRSYTDKSLKRGDERQYWVRTVYNDGVKTVESIEKKTTCSLPIRIEADDRDVYVGESFTIDARAVRSDGKEATVHNISFSKKEGVIEGENGHYTAKYAGEAYVRLSCAGRDKEVRIRVKNR